MVGVTVVVMGACLVCPNLDAVQQNLVGITLCRLLHCFLRPCCYTSGKFVHAYILLLAIIVIESISAMSCTILQLIRLQRANRLNLRAKHSSSLK